jgi:hypothetical protein
MAGKARVGVLEAACGRELAVDGGEHRALRSGGQESGVRGQGRKGPPRFARAASSNERGSFAAAPFRP